MTLYFSQPLQKLYEKHSIYSKGSNSLCTYCSSKINSMQGVKKYKDLSRNNEYIKLGQKTSVIRKSLQFVDLPGLSMHCSEVIFGPNKIVQLFTKNLQS